MSEKHIGEVVQVIGPVLDIRFAHDELPPLLNAIEIDNVMQAVSMVLQWYLHKERRDELWQLV